MRFPWSSKLNSTGHGPDYPESAGDREEGKFRASATPRATQVAVANDDGSRIGAGIEGADTEEVLLLRATVMGLSLITNTDLMTAVKGSS